MTRLRLTAPDVVARDQPNSCSSGSSSAPVEERNPAAATRAAMVTPATLQARVLVRASGFAVLATRASLGTPDRAHAGLNCPPSPGSCHEIRRSGPNQGLPRGPTVSAWTAGS